MQTVGSQNIPSSVVHVSFLQNRYTMDKTLVLQARSIGNFPGCV
jgi:hypothetical protein